ncbi:MAG TPA: chorismate synthase [Gemmatimonadaceae bacterium]|jgi:chorismate synthase|nr:chorismate synthase [Gemmatimonadaceae bacterium]
MIRFTTAGESHGPALVAIVEGLPAGLPLRAADIDAQLARRQQGHGRGRRMQIERDAVEFLSGVRRGETIGSPIAMLIRNRDWKNWEAIMDPAPREDEDPEAPRKRSVTRPRPGHADLTGMLKYARDDARDILERASARETTARVAASAACRRLLAEFGVRIGSHVVHLGGIDARRPDPMPDDINAVADQSPLRTLDPAADAAMVARVDEVKRDRNTLGGIAEVVVDGLPLGLGSHVSWDRKLDGRIAGALMSIQAVKGVEIGLGFEAARITGAEAHDEIEPAPGSPLTGNVRRRTNRAGGLEGGITSGEPLVVKVAMKPISTLMRPLATVDTTTGNPAEAVAERSDVTAVPAMAVIAEGMLALVLANAFAEKFGGDSLAEMRRNYESYISYLADRLGR